MSLIGHSSKESLFSTFSKGKLQKEHCNLHFQKKKKKKKKKTFSQLKVFK